jgi:hypothetical protein
MVPNLVESLCWTVVVPLLAIMKLDDLASNQILLCEQLLSLATYARTLMGSKCKRHMATIFPHGLVTLRIEEVRRSGTSLARCGVSVLAFNRGSIRHKQGARAVKYIGLASDSVELLDRNRPNS